MNWLTKATQTIKNWLVVGPDPKIRDPQNSAGGSAAGVAVSDRSVMGVSTFFACLRLLASTIGTLPLPVFRRGPNGVAIEDRDSDLWKVLHNSPNADQTPADFWEFVAISLMLRGHHYSRKLMDGKRLIGLEPIRPEIVGVHRQDNGTNRYRWTSGGENFDLDESEMFHIRGFGGGMSILQYAKESLGIAIAADRAAGAMFANSARPSGALSFKDFLTAEQRKAVKEDLFDEYQGAMNTGRPFIMEGGSTWTQVSMNADDAQLLQSRAWSVEEICRWFGVPPVMIGHNEKTTSWGTGVDQIVTAFHKFTLNPYLRRIEQAVTKQLLTPADRANGVFAQFNLEGLLRADSKGRAAYYEVMTRIGVMSRNECRAKENLPPVTGGDEIMVQSQYVPLAELIRQAMTEAS